MGRLTDFIRRERLYILLFILVVLMSLLMTMPGEVKVKSAKGDGALNIAKIEADKAKALQEELLKRAAIEEKVQKNRDRKSVV